MLPCGSRQSRRRGRGRQPWVWAEGALSQMPAAARYTLDSKTPGVCGCLVFKSAGVIAIAVISMLDRKRRQPRLAPDGPQFICRDELVRGVKRAKVHLGFVATSSKNRRPTARTKVPPCIGIRFACDRQRVTGKDRGGMEQCPVVFATVQTVTHAHAIGFSSGHKPDRAAQTSTADFVHDHFPFVAKPNSACRLRHQPPVGATIAINHVWEKGERLDNDPSGARYGCFLPDLTGLARRLPAPTSRRCI